MKNSFFFFIFLLFVSATQGQFDPGTVTIGTQTWMKINLDVSTYRNGDPTPEVKDSATWSSLTTGPGVILITILKTVKFMVSCTTGMR